MGTCILLKEPGTHREPWTQVVYMVCVFRESWLYNSVLLSDDHQLIPYMASWCHSWHVYGFKYTVKCRCYLNLWSSVNCVTEGGGGYCSLDPSLVTQKVVGGADIRQRRSSGCYSALVTCWSVLVQSSTNWSCTGEYCVLWVGAKGLRAAGNMASTWLLQSCEQTVHCR